LLNTCRGKSVWLVDCRVFISLSFWKICVVVSFHFHLPFVTHFIASHKCYSTSFRLTLFDCWLVWLFVAALVDCWSVLLVLRDAGPRLKEVFVATLWLLIGSFFVMTVGLKAASSSLAVARRRNGLVVGCAGVLYPFGLLLVVDSLSVWWVVATFFVWLVVASYSVWSVVGSFSSVWRVVACFTFIFVICSSFHCLCFYTSFIL
jgi:hypothetical protein